MKKLSKLFFIFFLSVILVSCGNNEDTMNDFEKIEVPEREEKYTYDENEPYFHGMGSEEEFKMLEKVKNTKLVASINGKEFELPISVEEFNSSFDILDWADRGDTNAEFLSNDGTSYYLHKSGDEITGFSFSDYHKPEYELVLPFGILVGDSEEAAFSKIDPDFFSPEEDYGYNVSVEELYPELVAPNASGFKTRNFVAGKYNVKLNFTDDRLSDFEINEVEDSLLGFYITKSYFYKNASESSNDAVITLNGKEFKFPTDFRGLENATNGTVEEFNKDNYKDYQYYVIDSEPDDFELETHVLLNIDGISYKVGNMGKAGVSGFSEENRVTEVTFDTSKPFSIKNDKFELNNDNILEIVDRLEEFNIPYDADTFYGLQDVEFYMDDNTKVMLNNHNRINIVSRARAHRVQDEGKYKKNMGIL